MDSDNDNELQEEKDDELAALEKEGLDNLEEDLYWKHKSENIECFPIVVLNFYIQFRNMFSFAYFISESKLYAAKWQKWN